jgi:hypothetical protein
MFGLVFDQHVCSCLELSIVLSVFRMVLKIKNGKNYANGHFNEVLTL